MALAPRRARFVEPSAAIIAPIDDRLPARIQPRDRPCQRAADRGNGNLLALAVDAARAKATVGEISSALEQVWGRHRAEIKTISGVFKREAGMTDAMARMQTMVMAFEADRMAVGNTPTSRTL